MSSRFPLDSSFPHHHSSPYSPLDSNARSLPEVSSSPMADSDRPGPSSHAHLPPESPRQNGYFEQLAGLGLGLGNLLVENILPHPFIVLRRQCQVHVTAEGNYHTTPFTLVPVVSNVIQEQGILCLWKGVTSSVVMKGFHFGLEMVAGDFFGLPRSVSEKSSLSKVGNHFLLKCAVSMLGTPLAAAAFVESVQSDKASERPSLLDCVREGFSRVSLDLFGSRDASRRLPIWLLVGPNAFYRLAHYFISGVTHYVTEAAVRRHIQKKPKRFRTLFDDFFPDLLATLTAHVTADVLLYPLETIVHRLFLQGTRTIIDNLDTGTTVMPITTRYQGLVDCARSVYLQEGWLGFYKGLGALVLQYSLHYAILRVIRVLFEQLEDNIKPSTKLQQ